jgi:hypothetical protein
MSVTITPADVKEIVSTTLGDDTIQCYIDTMEDKVGQCIDDNYIDATAKLIKTNLVAYLIAKSGNQNDVTQRRAPNGASITYSSSDIGKNGLLSNQYGRTVFELDSSLCWKGMIQSRVVWGTVGTKVNTKKPHLD